MINNEKEIVLFHHPNHTLLETLRENEVHLPGLCNAAGLCGRCMVKYCGYAPLPTQKERLVIGVDQLREGCRLACVSRPVKDCMIETVFGKEENINIVSAGIMDFTEDINVIDGSKHTLAAVDLGTTTIAMQLLDADSGRVWDTYTCLNPQRSYGMDVLTRIKASNEGNAAILKKLVTDALTEGLKQLIQFCANHKLETPELVVIACNTTMGHLFMGYQTEALGRSPFSPVYIGIEDFQWNQMRTILLPGISAFVGGDIIAGLYACDKYHENRKKKGMPSPETWMFLDLGTNAEMVIGNKEEFLCTAAAAGSAFEGNGLKNAKGTEKISALSRLLKNGIVNETGLLQEPYFEKGIVIDEIHITQEDIRDIQMAKAAIRAGIFFLTKNFGVSEYENINTLYIAGGFGFHLDKDAAVKIGLIPEKLQDKIEVVGNTALTGAGLFGRFFIKNNKEKEAVDKIVKKSMSFNLAEQKEFEKKYIEYMNFSL